MSIGPADGKYDLRNTFVLPAFQLLAEGRTRQVPTVLVKRDKSGTGRNILKDCLCLFRFPVICALCPAFGHFREGKPGDPKAATGLSRPIDVSVEQVFVRTGFHLADAG
jgi:hypothetical protein